MIVDKAVSLVFMCSEKHCIDQVNGLNASLSEKFFLTKKCTGKVYIIFLVQQMWLTEIFGTDYHSPERITCK